MKKSSMANAKPPECNSISTTEVAVIDITKSGFNGVKLVRETSIPLYLPKSLTMVRETLIRVSGSLESAEILQISKNCAN